jgi:cytidylate kinase
MAVITISRGIFSGGEDLAECLAARLGYRCVDRDALVQRAAADGIDERELKSALLESPDLLERLRRKRRLYLAALRAALAEEVATGDVVYHGNAGHLLLKGVLPVLRVRIVAPLESRLATLQERLGWSREEGRAHIARIDEERRKWTAFLYGVQWEDPSIYDIVINLERLGIPGACDVLVGLARADRFALTSERQAAVRDFALASRVWTALRLDRRTANLEVEVRAHAGTAYVQGFVGSDGSVWEIERVAGQVPGVQRLDVSEVTVYYDGW